MGDLCIFLNNRIEGSGFLAGVGDFSLTPVRYWCYGNTARVEGQRVDHVTSFHPEGEYNRSRTNRYLRPSETGMLKALFAVACFVPGLFLGVIFKTFAYLFQDMRERHDLVKRHYTPIVRHIGTAENPITTEEALSAAMGAEFNNTPLHQPTDAIIIHGRNLNINLEPGILEFNPMKLILEGASIVHAPASRERLDDEMRRTGKWDVATVRAVTGAHNANNSFASARALPTIDAALAATLPRRGWFTCKRTHMIYTVQPPAPAPAPV